MDCTKRDSYCRYTRFNTQGKSDVWRKYNVANLQGRMAGCYMVPPVLLLVVLWRQGGPGSHENAAASSHYVTFSLLYANVSAGSYSLAQAAVQRLMYIPVKGLGPAVLPSVGIRKKQNFHKKKRRDLAIFFSVHSIEERSEQVMSWP